jgi:hypothetical protein
MTDEISSKLASDISAKLNVLISLSLRRVLGDNDFSTHSKAKRGVGDVVRYLANMGIDPRDIAQITGSPLTSVRTLLTPTRRR